MSYSYNVRVAADNTAAEVVLEVEVDGVKAIANIGSRAARRIAIQMLQVAGDMDDLRDSRH
jgi:hypothetical protein